MKEGVTVDAAALSLIQTDMSLDVPVNPNVIPGGRFGMIEEVVDVLVMLAINGYITGQTLYVNGGMHMT